MPDSTADKITETIDDVNKVLGALIPMVPVVAGIAKLVIQLAKRNGVPVGTFEEEIRKFDILITELKRTDAEWRRAHDIED